MWLLSISVRSTPSCVEGLRHFGRNLADARSSAHISGSDLARQAGCTPSAIWGIEHGRSLPSLDLACRIADALETTLNDLLRGDR